MNTEFIIQMIRSQLTLVNAVREQLARDQELLKLAHDNIEKLAKMLEE